MKPNQNIDDLISDKFNDLMSDFLFYDRKEDEDLSRDALLYRLSENPQLVSHLSELCREKLYAAIDQ